ncbi:MAG: DNA-packaging protein [Bacillota bacterium]
MRSPTTRENASLAESLASLPSSERERILKDLSKREAEGLLFDWKFWARPNQMPPPGDWFVWLLLSGRGFGKTRTGAEWIRARAASGKYSRIALVAETAADARDVMIEGESGVLAVSPPWFMPEYEPSKRRLTWPNGAIATTYSGKEPEQLRGPQHDTAWVDELAKFKYPEATWDNLELGLRLGPDPRCVVTTTPKPIKIIKSLLADSDVTITRGSSYENIGNLAPSFIRRVIKKYEGTTLGRQELWAQLLEDAQGALWKRAQIDKLRVVQMADLVRIVVSIDPAASNTEDSDETGIVVGGLGSDGHGYILEDLSLHASPDGWARAAVAAYNKYKADRVVAEVNNGGDMVEHTVRTVDQNVAYTAVHASRGKVIRAEPVSALYEQGRVHHVGTFGNLEDQLCSWEPTSGQKSPDRLDALVWLVTELMLGGGVAAVAPDVEDEGYAADSHPY